MYLFRQTQRMYCGGLLPSCLQVRNPISDLEPRCPTRFPLSGRRLPGPFPCSYAVCWQPVCSTRALRSYQASTSSFGATFAAIRSKSRRRFCSFARWRFSSIACGKCGESVMRLSPFSRLPPMTPAVTPKLPDDGANHFPKNSDMAPWWNESTAHCDTSPAPATKVWRII